MLTLICTNEDQGAVAANLIDIELFEPPLDDIAKRAIAYRKKYKRPPGIAHIDDLFDHILSDPKNKRFHLYQRVLQGIIDQAKGLNAEYVLSRVNDFVTEQELKSSVISAAERFQQGGDAAVDDVKNIFHQALKFKAEGIDAGTFLGDRRKVLGFLGRPQHADYALGIEELDRRGIGPTRGEALGFMAPKGRGKTWFCVHAGTMCLLQGAKVAHVSLEMKDERIMPRYIQRLFAVAKRKEKYAITKLELDDLGRLEGLVRTHASTELTFSDPRFLSKIAKEMEPWGERLNRLVVRAFPTSTLTMGHLEAWLDSLELTYGFVPDVLVLDYPKLMALDRRQELRIALGLRYEELRGLLMRRNLAGVFPMQSNREGEEAKLLTAKFTGEDYSIPQTLDMFLTYSATKFERNLGLARLYVDKARNDDDDFTVLITQSYKTGQFVRQSAFMSVNYFDQLNDLVGASDD